MAKISLILLILLFTGCSECKRLEAVESKIVMHKRSGNSIEEMDMGNNVKCYIYQSNGISCVYLR